MIEKIAIRLSNAWGENGVVTTEDVECYRYGLELMISTIFNFILTVVVSVVLAKPYSFLPFTIVYVPMRLYAGGYHAKNHFRCILFSTILFGITVVEALILVEQQKYACMFIIIISFVILRLIAPIESENKPLSTEQIVNAKHKISIIQSILFVIYIILYIFNNFTFYFSICYYAEFSVCITVLLSKISRLKH